jgi:hypothetical protein
MQTPPDAAPQRGMRIPLGVGLCLFLGIAIFFLWEEHRAHILGIAPYVLLLMCPLIHLFMHRGHAGHDAGHTGHDGQAHRHEDGGAS